MPRSPLPALACCGVVLILAAGAGTAAALPPSGTAEALLAAGRLREGRAVLEARYRSDPAEPGTAGTLARVRARTGDYPAALELYDTLLVRDPADTRVRLERARVLAWMGRYGEAAHATRELVAGDPANEEAWVVLANATLWDGDPAEARRIAREGLSHLPQSAPLLAWMAGARYRDGRVGDARRVLARALALDPELRLETDPSLYSAFLLESRFVYEDVSPLGPWRDMALSMAWRPPGSWAARGGLERIDRFGLEEVALEGALSRAAGAWRMEAAVQGAPGATVLPRWGIGAAAAWIPGSRWRVETGVHRNHYASGSTLRLDAGASRTWGAVWETGYRLTWTRDVLGAGDATHTVTARWIPSSTASIRLDVFHGTDVTRSPAGADVTTDATTGVAAAGQFPVAAGWGVGVSASLTDRDRSYRRESLGFGFVRRF